MPSELGGLRFVVSHPCAEKIAQGWGTHESGLVQSEDCCR
jgi:hypothetical protein